MKVGDANVQELRRKLLKEEDTGKRRWALPTFIVILAGGTLFIREFKFIRLSSLCTLTLVYIRGNQTVRRLCCCCPGQVERNQMQPIARFDSDERLV